jgi:enoyl-[acyl-carrier-protein] reductase (NADH)
LIPFLIRLIFDSKQKFLLQSRLKKLLKWDVYFEGKEEALAKTKGAMRMLLAEDVAAAVIYLFSAPAITGQILYVDAGQHLLGNGV